MMNLEDFFEKIKEITPSFVEGFYQQTQEVQSKIIDIFIKESSLVTRKEYDQQIDLYKKLVQRCLELEAKLESIYPLSLLENKNIDQVND